MSNPALYIDKALTGVSNAWENDDNDFIADSLFPVVTVNKPTFKVGKYGKDGLRLPSNTLRTGESKAKRVNLTRGFDDIGPLQEHSLSDFITKDDYDLTDDPFEPESDSVENMNSIMALVDEKDLASQLTNTSIITQNTTLSGTAQWNDYDNSDPITDIVNGITTGKFVNYNTIAMGQEVWYKISQHPVILDRLKWSERGVVTIEAFLSLLAPYGITKLLIGKAKENTGKEGLADNISTVWGKNVILAFVQPKPGRKKVNGGYKFALKNGREVSREAKNNPRGTELVNTDYYGHFLLSTDCFYLIKNAVA